MVIITANLHGDQSGPQFTSRMQPSHVGQSNGLSGPLDEGGLMPERVASDATLAFTIVSIMELTTSTGIAVTSNGGGSGADSTRHHLFHVVFRFSKMVT
jgi:hypothetical protein